MKASEFDFPVISSPFGEGDIFRDYSSYKTGFTAPMLAPVSQGGQAFTRHMLNGLGYLSTLGTFLTEIGYPFEVAKVPEIAQKFGGYPKGAIVYTIDPNGWVVEYQSLVDDNTNPIPDLDESSHTPVGNDFWKPLYETMELIGVPNYGNNIATTTQTVDVSSMVDNSFEVTLSDITEDAMIVVTRTISNFNSLSKINLIYGAPDILCSVVTSTGYRTELCSMPLTNGAEDTQMFPVGAGSNIVVSSSNYNTAIYGNITISINAYAMTAAE